MRERISQSFLDDDLYKIKTCYAISELYPDATAEFRFINRGKHPFINEFCNLLRYYIDNEMVNCGYYNWIGEQLPYVKKTFLKWLATYYYNPKEVTINYIPETKDMEIIIKGNWMRITLWEVKLMAIISELYYKFFYSEVKDLNYSRLSPKAKCLSKSGPDFKVIDFGTRRRASLKSHEKMISTLKPFLSGTSNMYFAKEYNIPVKGSMPHEWIMGVGALHSLRYANKYALYEWARVFPDPGIALSDTFGIDAFFNDFNVTLAKLYDGTRQDSGDPLEYTKRIVLHYKKLGIDPKQKKIIFSDSLDLDKALILKSFCDHIGINSEFGIGTYLTNDFKEFNPLNIVIKPWAFNNIPVVKLGEGEGKVSGDPKAIEYTKWVFGK